MGRECLGLDSLDAMSAGNELGKGFCVRARLRLKGLWIDVGSTSVQKPLQNPLPLPRLAKYSQARRPVKPVAPSTSKGICNPRIVLMHIILCVGVCVCVGHIYGLGNVTLPADLTTPMRLSFYHSGVSENRGP